MAAGKRQKSKRRGKRKPSAGWLQKLLLGVSGTLMILCAASITYGFFIRQSGAGASESEFRIEVLNGTGKQGLAHAAKRGLLRRGIDVIEVGNADHFSYEQSVLIARKPGTDVELLGKAIGCRNVVEQLSGDGLEDATLILGSDYQRLHLDWGLETDLFE